MKPGAVLSCGGVEAGGLYTIVRSVLQREGSALGANACRDNSLVYGSIVPSPLLKSKLESTTAA